MNQGKYINIKKYSEFYSASKLIDVNSKPFTYNDEGIYLKYDNFTEKSKYATSKTSKTWTWRR